MKKIFNLLIGIFLLQLCLSAQTADSYYSQAYNLSARGDKQGAIENYTKAIQSNSNYKKAYAERGILYHSLKETDKALADFSKALSIDSKYDYARRNRAAIYMEQENFEAAVKDYNQLIAQDAQFSFYYDLRGVANYKIGEKEQALADFNKCLELSPNNEKVQVKRAKLLLELGKEEEAYSALSNTDYSKEKLSTEAKLQLARSSRKMGEYQKSLNFLSDLENTQFKPEIVFLEKGLCHLHLKQFSEAINAFDKCLSHNPNNEIAYVNKASAQSQNKEYAKAVETYTAILNKWGQKHYRALNGRAIAYYGMGEAESACTDWESAAALGDSRAKENYASYCSEEQLDALTQEAAERAGIETAVEENIELEMAQELEEAEEKLEKINIEVEEEAEIEEELEQVVKKKKSKKEKKAKKEKN